MALWLVSAFLAVACQPETEAESGQISSYLSWVLLRQIAPRGARRPPWRLLLAFSACREVLHGVGADGVGVKFPIFAVNCCCLPLSFRRSREKRRKRGKMRQKRGRMR